MKKISTGLGISMIIVLGGVLYFSISENVSQKHLNEALLNESKKRLQKQYEGIKLDSIKLYVQKNEFIEHINNLQQLRNNDRNEYKRKLSQLKLVTNSDYINRNDSLYKYLQGSR